MKTSTKTGTLMGLLALAVAAGCTLVWFDQAGNVDLPENRTLFVAVWLSAVVLGITAFVKKAGWLGRLAAVGAVVIGLFLPFTVSISEQLLPADAIRVGETIPNFSAPDDRGEIFDSARLRGKPVLIKFFRAHW